MADDTTFTAAALAQRAQRCAERHGVQLPAKSAADSETRYLGRCASLFQKFCPELKDIDFKNFRLEGSEHGNEHFKVTSRLASQVFDAADKARPRGGPDGGLRYVSDRSTGREIIRAYADNDDACWRQFTNVSFMVGKFRRPDAGALAASQERAKGWWQP